MPRERSATAHRKVIEAAVELVAERGVDGASMDAIAAASGVSKATIYKHWADKDALLLDVMATVTCLDVRPSFDSGNTRADMIAVLSHRPRERASARERTMPEFIAYSARNPNFSRAWRKMMMESPRRELKHLLKLAVARREITRDANSELAFSLLLGPMLYWHIFLRRDEEDAKPLAKSVVDAFFRAFGTKQKAAAASRRAAVSSKQKDTHAPPIR